MKPNCIKCKHYFITFDQHSPKGCRAYRIKSKQLPAMVVRSANKGEDCIGFEAKEEKERTQKNLNDSKYW